MSAKIDQKHAGRIDGLVSAGTCIAGDVLFSGGLRIDGEVRGNVRTRDGETGTVVIGEKGRIEGSVEATHVIINGQVTGRVNAMECLELQSKARVNSDVGYSSIAIHAGAVVEGQLTQRPVAPDAQLPLAANA